MSKTILAQVDGFTPLPDLLTKRYGLITSAVFGLMWRYCQMKDGICRCALERLADELNISRMTVIRHIETLVNDGFLKDTTPALRNRPHIYADTGKVAMYNKWGMAEGGVSESYSETCSTVPESYSTVTESDSHCNTELLEDSKKKEIKKVNTPKSKIQMPENAPIDWLIAGGVSSEKIAELNQKEAEVKSATDAFERALNFNPLPWGKNAQWQRFKKFVMGAYQQDPASFKKFHDKREKEGQFSRLPANPKIYQDPDLLIAIWPGLFPRPTEADQSARILASIAAQYHG